MQPDPTPERRQALIELMALPDPPCLEPRCHVLTVEGHAQRSEWIQALKAITTEYERERKGIQ